MLVRRKESLPFGRTLDPCRRHFMQSLVRAPYNSGSSTKWVATDSLVSRSMDVRSGQCRRPDTGTDNKDKCQTDHADDEGLHLKHEFLWTLAIT